MAYGLRIHLIIFFFSVSFKQSYQRFGLHSLSAIQSFSIRWLKCQKSRCHRVTPKNVLCLALQCCYTVQSRQTTKIVVDLCFVPYESNTIKVFVCKSAIFQLQYNNHNTLDEANKQNGKHLNESYKRDRNGQYDV